LERSGRDRAGELPDDEEVMDMRSNQYRGDAERATRAKKIGPFRQKLADYIYSCGITFDLRADSDFTYL
jgi:hypothetical protein